MASSAEAAKKGSAWGCVIPLVTVLLAFGIWVGSVGVDMITDTPPALCGGSEMDEGDTCNEYSRHSGDKLGEFDAAESQNSQDSSKDFFGWIVVVFGGAVALTGVGVLVGAITYRPRPSPTSV
ncbi:hypothetical protein [Streptomyces sp. NPDC055243]|uniref:hypothetical protein n=1 Tax=Streptomyces sp. NPDC055243 TaxID=3365720 RepID=UPI0037D969C1